MRRRIRLQKRGVWQRDLEVLGGAVVVESSSFVVVGRRGIMSSYVCLNRGIVYYCGREGKKGSWYKF